jgi:hypothetical protein
MSPFSYVTFTSYHLSRSLSLSLSVVLSMLGYCFGHLLGRKRKGGTEILGDIGAYSHCQQLALKASFKDVMWRGNQDILGAMAPRDPSLHPHSVAA